MYIKKTDKGYNMGGNTYDHNYISQYLADGGGVNNEDGEPQIAEGIPEKIPVGTKVNGVTWNGKNWVQGKNVYSAEGGKQFENVYKQKFINEQNAYKNDIEAANRANNPNYKSQTKTTAQSKPVSKNVANKAAQNIQRTGSPWANSVGFNPKAIDESQNQNVVVPGDTNTTDLGDPTESGILGTKSDLNQTQGDVLTQTAQKASNNPDKQPPVGKTWKDTLKGVDWEMLGAGAQAALGTYYLNKSGKRPMYQLDPEFVKNVDLQKANAAYGYTPEQRAELESESNGLTQQQLFAAQNYSGGSAGSAYNKSRLAINDSFKRNLELTANDQEIKQNKQANVNNLIAQKAAMKNMMFQDQLNAWSANQSAGANLLGAGIRNLINKSRLDKELDVESQANNLVNNVN